MKSSLYRNREKNTDAQYTFLESPKYRVLEY